MKIKIHSSALAVAILAVASYTIPVFAETSVSEKVQESAEHAGNSAKKAGRAVKDKACEMVNGKLECVGKKAANKMRNARDDIRQEVKDKTNDGQKKVD